MEKIETLEKIAKSQLINGYLLNKIQIKINEIIEFLNITRDEVEKENKKINELVEITNILIKDRK